MRLSVSNLSDLKEIYDSEVDIPNIPHTPSQMYTQEIKAAKDNIRLHKTKIRKKATRNMSGGRD